MADERSEQVFHAHIAGAAKLCCHPARWMNWNLARLLIGRILSVFSCLAVTVTDRMVAKTVNTSGGCVVPTPATTFLTTGQSVGDHEKT
jgi:hypothetical protein